MARRITFDGQTLSLVAWLRRTGITDNAYRERKRRGWTERQALLTPRGGDPVAVKRTRRQPAPLAAAFEDVERAARVFLDALAEWKRTTKETR